MRNRRTIVLGGLILAVLGCREHGSSPGEALDRAKTVDSSGDYVHEASGMRFPDALGDFRKENVKQYDREGRDVSVGYNLVAPSRILVATVFVYPSPPCASLGSSPSTVQKMKDTLAAREFGRCRAEVLEAHPDGKALSEGPFELGGKGGPRRGRRASFEYLEDFGPLRTPASSELYLFCYVGDRWTVMVRFTHPRDLDVKADIRGFLDGLEWTTSGE